MPETTDGNTWMAEQLLEKATGDPASKAIAYALISIAKSLSHLANTVAMDDDVLGHIRVGAEVSGSVKTP